MADLGEHFDPNAVPPSDYNADPIPPNKYLMQITDSEVVDTKDGTGRLLKLKIEVAEGEYQNRIVWDQINIRNQSQKAQEIGQQQLAEIFRACGVSGGRDSSLLHFKRFHGDVRIETDKKGEYPPKNVVKKFWPSTTPGGPQNATPPTQREAPAATNGAQPQSGAKRPWPTASAR